MSRRIHPVLTILILVLTGIFLLTATASALWNLDYAQSRWGVVAAKGRVLGPNNKPIWVEYDAQGNVVRNIGEAHEEPLENAEVISGHAYRTYEQAYRAVQAQYADIEVLTAETYQSTTFMGPNGEELSKPALAFNTNSVVVRDPQSVYGSMNLVLLQSVLDLTRLEILPESVTSVLLSSGGWVIATSQQNIGYRTAFYTPKENIAHEVEGTWIKGKDDMTGLDMDEHKLWGPINGVEITGGIEPTWSDHEGRFRAYRSSSCDTLNFVNAKLRYSILDPQDKFPGHYTLTQDWQPDCWWVPECLPGAGPSPTGNGTLAGMMMYIAYQNQCMQVAPNGLGYAPISTIKHNYTAKIKFHVDVVMVSGAIRLRNPAGTLNVAGGDDTVYAYTAPLFTTGPPDGIRVPDTAPDFAHQGLLATISEADLKKTDLYIFRTSNDQLLMAREGLADDETLPYFVGGFEQREDVIKFNLLMRGPNSDRDYSVRKMKAVRPIWLFENHQKATGVNPELYGRKADHLRIGETVKVVAVNRATGYIGTGVGRYGSPAAVIGDSENQADVQTEHVAQLFISPIYLQPPNLKIKVERKFNVDAGLTKGQAYKNIIGFEGAGLSDDTFVAVSTQWYDHDGTPLPADLPGYTGRLAKVVSQDTLGSHVDNFEIKPGKHLQLVRLPQGAVDNHHYYLHISGEPVKGNPDFGETGAAPDGPLAYRPAHYVPIQVPLFDEAATNVRKAAYQARIEAGDTNPAKPEPAYRWYYRPEMQFTVFDLDIRANPDMKTLEDIPIPKDTILPYSYGNDIDFLYTLLQDELPVLDPLGPERVLVFGYGDEEVGVTIGDISDTPGEVKIGAEGRIIVENIEQLENLDAYDLLTVRLYQNGDDANVLWEYTSLGIDVSVENPYGSGCRIMQGQSLTLLGNTKPAGRYLRWSIIKALTDPGVLVRLEPQNTNDPAKCLVVPEEETASGFVWIRVSDVKEPHIFVDVAIQVGCEECEDCHKPGAASIRMGSINARISLGATGGGLPAGDLFIKAQRPSPELATPKALLFSTLQADDVEIRSEHGKGLRQILAPQSLADIVTLDDFSYEIRFYEADAVTGTQAGRFTVDNGASPNVTWRIENPDASADTYDTLVITEIRNGQSKASTFTWNDAQSTWSLAQGNGKKITTQSEQVDADGNRIVTVEMRNSADEVASVVRTTWHPFPFGEAMIEQVVDPDGEALTSTVNYYDSPDLAGSYRRIASRIDPHGAWTKYHYDTQGRTTSIERTWLDMGADSGAGSARMTSYSYVPVDGDDAMAADEKHNPRTVTEQVAGIVVSKTYNAYLIDEGGRRTHISEGCADASAAYGDGANLRTITTYYPTSAAEEGRIQSVQYPDQRLERHTYEYGTWNGSQFAAGTGRAQRHTITYGTVANPDGLANQTTRQISISDAVGNTVRSETQVYTGSGYATVQWSRNIYDSQGHLTQTTNSDGTGTSAAWNCCGRDSTTNALGIQTSYSYDDLQRVQSATRHLASGDITTSYTYDAAGRQLTRTVTGGALSLDSAASYDSTGRMESATDTAGRTTGYDYSADGLTTTVTRPGNITEITTRYLDGRTRSVTGTGVVARYYTYGVNTDGTQWTQVNTGAADAPQWQRTVTDQLGRTVRTAQSGYSGTVTVENYYDSTGRLVRTSTPGQADTLYVYDDLGNPIRGGLDVDASGTLEPDTTDRISETETGYAHIDGHWWQQTTHRVYAADNDATATTTAIQRQQLTGLGGVTAHSVAIDIHGNRTESTTTIDAASQRETRTMDYADSTIDAQSVTIGGLPASATTKSGVTTTFGYDPLGRRIETVDARTGTTTTHYDDKGQVDWIEDPAGNRTSFVYDPDTGRKLQETNALTRTTYFAYNHRGQVTHTWGQTPYPVHYVYDDLGRMTAMHTYRTDAGFDAAAFPTGAAADVTRWHYHPASGLLEAKEYADGSRVEYTYTAAGKLETRTWARQSAGADLVTTYAYDPATGELTGIDYSDATADIGFTYDRLGRQTEITDAVGTRTLAYNADLQPETETITGLYDQTLTRSYENTAVPGRATGFSLGAGHSVTYGYEPATGRFATIDWSAAGQSDSVTYGYLANSDLIEQVATAGGRQTTYGYEPHRNLKTVVQNSVNSTTVSQYDYLYDELGRRESVANSGSAFAQAAFSRYGYNHRSELTSAHRYLGADVNDLTSPVPAEQRAFDYDPIGNRLTATADTAASTYTANALNQYSQIDGAALAYDADGNMVADAKGMVYTYNAENRLIAAQPQTPADGDTRVEYLYDYMGRRVQKVVYLYGSGSWNQDKEVLFVYNGWNLVKETTVASGQTAVDKYCVWGLDLSQSQQGAGGVGGLLAAVEGSLTYHYLYDANGNVGQVIDAGDGSIAAHYEYDPYGNEVLATGSLAADNVYRFSTKYFDKETNLYYYGYRYYSPQVGRWVNRDPMGERGGLNIYASVYNSGINNVDFLGMKPTECYRCDEMKKNYDFNVGELEHSVKLYRIHKKLIEETDFALQQLENAKKGIDPKGLGVDFYKWAYENMHLPYLKGFELKHNSIAWQEEAVRWYQKESIRDWQRYESCYNENKCGGCLEWYCRGGSSWIGAGLDGVSLLLATTEIGLPGAAVTYGLSMTNDIVSWTACGLAESSKQAMKLDSGSFSFSVLSSATRKAGFANAAKLAGKGAPVFDLISLFVNINSAMNAK